VSFFSLLVTMMELFAELAGEHQEKMNG